MNMRVNTDKNTKFDVVVDGVFKTRINSSLVLRQKISDSGLKKIIALHVERIKMEEAFVSTENKMSGEEYWDKWTQNQYALQEAWGFEKNGDYHVFWKMGGCSCPSMDNQMNYPSGPYYFKSNCAVHGFMMNRSTKFEVNPNIKKS